MGGFGSIANSQPKPKRDEKKKVPSLSYKIEEEIRMIEPISLGDDQIVSGWDIALVGESKSGKTDSAISLGYMNLEFEDLLLKAGLNEIVEALKEKAIPEVKKIVIIDSENALRSQLGYPYEKSMFAPLRDRISIIPIEISNLKKIASPEGDVDFDPESVEKMTASLKKFNAAIEYVSRLDENTLVIVDSMSIYKQLLDLVTGYMAQVRIKNTVDPKERSEIRMERWQERNAWWMDSLRKLRGFKGWSVSTFMMKENSQWVVEAFKAERLKPIWTETTEYNYDMVVEMSIDRMTNVRVASIKSARYIDVDNPNDNRVEIYGKIEREEDRVQFLGIIDKSLKIARGGFGSWKEALS